MAFIYISPANIKNFRFKLPKISFKFKWNFMFIFGL